jgi:autoinducer 2-degrading protein
MKPFVLVVQLRIKPGCIEKVMPEVLENARAARATEPGCQRFDVLVDPQDRHRVMLYEVYESEAAFAAHEKTPHFQHYLATVPVWLEARERFRYELAAP